MKRESTCPITGIKTISYLDENGKYHRTDGPAHITVYTDGPYEAWYIHGDMHREDGPAEFKGGKEYWVLNDYYVEPSEMPLNVFLSYCKWTYKKKK